MSTQQNETYYINLPVFEGPFDLLLFFIERDELDILNIPIAKITNDFLAYIRSMEAINIDLGSEFIVVAATLMKIKARNLLPVKKAPIQEGVEDPEQDLIRKILLFKSFKEVATELSDMEDERLKMHDRGSLQEHLEGIKKSVASVSELESASLYHLMKAFESLMGKLGEKPSKTIHQLVDYPYTIQTSKIRIAELLKNKSKLSFDTLFNECENRIHAIVIFLSILEMVNSSEISIINTTNDSNDFYLVPNEIIANEIDLESE